MIQEANPYYCSFDSLESNSKKTQRLHRVKYGKHGRYEIPNKEMNRDIEFKNRMIYASRPTIIEHMIAQFPDYLLNEPETEQIRFLSNHYNCNCSDCNGNDYCCKCNVEEAFYQLFEIPYPKYSSSKIPNKKSRFSMTYADFEKVIETTVEL
tara:strand:+ start:141 stop:596 length:456 start_codon:yes stop_codon:yes gene_type:complete